MAFNLDELEPSKRRKVEEYQAIIGEEEPVEEFIEALEKSNWDIESALELRKKITLEGSLRKRNTSKSEAIVAGDKPVQQPTSLYGLSALFKVKNDHVKKSNIPKAMLQHAKGLITFEDNNKANEKWVQEFELENGTAHPKINTSGYLTLINTALRNMSVLVVYIYDKDNERSMQLCRNVICNQEFTLYTKTYSVQLYFCDVRSSQYAQILRDCPSDGDALFAFAPNNTTLKMDIHKIDGTTTSGVIESLNKIYMSSCRQVVEKWKRCKQVEETRIINDQRDQAYLSSLKADILKEQKLKRKSEIKKNKEEKKALRIKSREKARAQFLARQEDEQQLNQKDFANIRIILPSESRIERKFRKDSSIEDIYNFVDIQNLSPLAPGDEFVLYTSPQRIPLTNKSQTISDANLTPSANLFVEALSSSSSGQSDY